MVRCHMHVSISSSESLVRRDEKSSQLSDTTCMHAHWDHARGAPMVEIKVLLKASSEKRKSTHVLPTALSPISSSLNR